MRHRAYNSSVRLAHRWLASHRLAHQIPAAAVELLVAHAFWYGRGEATTAAAADTAAATSSGCGGGDGQYSSTGAWGGAFAVPGTAAAGKKANQRLAANGGSGGGLGYPDGVPSTAFHGFHRFLLLLASHDFLNSPVVVEPEPYAKSDDNGGANASNDGDDGENAEGNPDDASSVYGQGSADVSKRSTKALSSTDRRAIRTAFETARESSRHHHAGAAAAGAAGASAPLAAGGRVRASAMWVVAPYDRAHGWLSSWGVCHGSSPATAHAGFPSVAPTAAQRPSSTTTSSGSNSSTGNSSNSSRNSNSSNGGVPLGLGGCGNGVVLSNGFEGPDEVALAQVVQTAKESLAHLHAWVRAAGHSIEEGEGGHATTSTPSTWEAAFTPAEPHLSLGAAVALRVSPKTVAAAAAAATDEDTGDDDYSHASSSSCVSGAALLNGHCHGPTSSLLRIKPYKNAGTAAKKSQRGNGGSGSSMVVSGSGSDSNNNDGPFSGVSASERLVGLRPLELVVAELRARFGHLAIFYTDAIGPASCASNSHSSSSCSGGGPCVYVAWRSAWLEPQPFRVLESAFRRLDPPQGEQIGEGAAGAKRSAARQNSDSSDNSDDDDETDPFSATAAGQGSSAIKASPKKALAVGDPSALVSAMLACSSGVLDRAKFL